MEQELISIVVPVYRAERYIEETMDCVRAQTYPHWELLLVEDCGPDRSRNSPMRMARAPERLSVCRPRLLIKKL